MTTCQQWDHSALSTTSMLFVSSISVVWTRKHTPTGVCSFQRVSPTYVSNRFGEFPLICFIWVYVCVCIDDLKSRKRGWDVGGGRDAVIRSGLLTSLRADKAGHTHTHSDSHSRTSKTDNAPQRYLLVPLSLGFFQQSRSFGLQQGKSIVACLQEIKCTPYFDESFSSKTRSLSTEKPELYSLLISAKRGKKK